MKKIIKYSLIVGCLASTLCCAQEDYWGNRCSLGLSCDCYLLQAIGSFFLAGASTVIKTSCNKGSRSHMAWCGVQYLSGASMVYSLVQINSLTKQIDQLLQKEHAKRGELPRIPLSRNQV